MNRLTVGLLAAGLARGGEIYNFWRDATHVRGIWRKTSLQGYRGQQPAWDVILDIDRLAEAEGESWVWSNVSCRYPDYDRCLVGLSIGGADAAVQREFDLDAREWVGDGFVLPESKSSVTWRDRDSVFLGPAFSDEQVTDSGYPRTVQVWRRGTPFETAETIFEGERGDVASWAARIWDGDEYHELVIRFPDFFSRVHYLYRNGKVERLNLPSDAEIPGIIHGQLLPPPSPT